MLTMEGWATIRYLHAQGKGIRAIAKLKDSFPKVSRSPLELRRQVMDKYRSILPFPPT
ncbi:MAG: hypothetical protein HW416_1783 [Chloroflexi bacterium]|nr:hypothetical protein [Chloroflexota bacterium]